MSTDKKIPFGFVLEELEPIRPHVRRAFGFTYVYLDGTTEHIDSLGREFPELQHR